jgi:16S rRNA processing protein RimM
MASPSTDEQKNDQYLIFGRFGAKHGVRGWQRLISYTHPIENLLSYSPLFIQKHHKWEKMTPYETMWQGNVLLIRLADCTSPEQAACYTGLPIGIAKSQMPLPKENEYYWAELEGMQVYHESGQFFGTVDYLLNCGANDILVVKGEQRRMIPFINDHPIIHVDRKERKIIVDWDPTI